MTNNYLDFENSTAFIIFSNPAEAHPVAMQFILNAVKNNGAKMIVIDPRRTRTAAMAEQTGGLHVRIRSGTDTAFISGLMREIIARQEAGTLYNGHLTETVSRNWWPDDLSTQQALVWPRYTDAVFKLNATRTDYEREAKTLGGGGTATGMPVVTTLADPDSVYQNLKTRLAPFTPAAVAEICGCTEAEFNAVADMYIASSWATTHTTYDQPGYQAGALLYAMGTTQHSKGSQNTRITTLVQLLLGNVGKAGGGVNALRGTGNVQGSTDMGVLFGNTIGYNYKQPSGPEGTFVGMEAAYEAYVDGLFGDPYPEKADVNEVPIRFQQHGYHNNLHAWFSDGSSTATAKADTLHAFYPKGNGLNHEQFFRQMDPSQHGYRADLPAIKAMVNWAENPAVMEAHSDAIVDGLKALDLLVVADIFLNETADVERKADGVTYFLPAAGFSETPGEVATSGRWLQWRFAARNARGNTKVDFELLLRLAKALHDNGAIVSGVAGTDAWPDANYDGAVAGSDNGFTSIWGQYFLGSTWNGTGTISLPAGTWDKAVNTEIAENTYRELAAPLGGVADPRGAAVNNKTWYGALWIYSNATGGAKVGALLTKSTVIAGYEPLGTPAGYANGVVPDGSLEGFITVDEEGKVTDFDGILAKSYNPWDAAPPNDLGIHPYWVFAWLFNRRIFYNQGTTVAAGDTADLFVAPDQVARLFVHHNADVIGPTGAGRTNPVANYAWFYRVYSKFADADFRFPRHAEPHESPLTEAQRSAIETTLGGLSIAPIGLESVHSYANTDALRAEYPLVLTTIRYVMHYQSGATTRHQSWLNQTRPHPYLEMHPDDAAARGIVNGDDVYIQNMRCENLGPWVALVDDTIKQGIVAVPWHWGNRGLSTGPTANFATIDALDANTTMPETKACLCQVTKGEE